MPMTSRRAGEKSIINCSTASINYLLFLFVEHFFKEQVAPLKSVNESTIPREEFIYFKICGFGSKFERKDVSAERQNLSFKRLRKDFNPARLSSRNSVLLVQVRPSENMKMRNIPTIISPVSSLLLSRCGI